MTQIEISATLPHEAKQIINIASKTQVFSAAEISTLNELLEDYLAKGELSHYHFISSRLNNVAIGFACYGHRSLTHGTFDLYWISTAPEAQLRGVGKALLTQVEEEIRAIQGRLIIAETSSTTKYASARNFYQAQGYHCAATINDFYREGDHLVIYSKKIK